jgi:hypothetical protein
MDTTQSATDKSTADSRTTAEALRDELVAANSHVENPEAQQHVDRAIKLLNDLPPTPLVECPECDRVGLPERIAVHDCL